MVRQAPTQIGRFKILGELGRGSMGCVHLALDPNIERKVAIKVLDPVSGVGAAEEEELRRRFVLEARAAGRASHPGIVTVYDAETDPVSGSSFIAMEWVDGPSLETVLANPGPLPIAQAIEIVGQIAEALGAAHRVGLVHRDVKPANILVSPSGQAKISDFGIAKFTSMSNTAAGRILGSPLYMSPEQVRNEAVDQRSDLFSLGVVLYQAVTGAVPFGGDSLAGITHKILEIDPAPARTLNPEVAPELGAVIDRALAKDPALRFQTADEFARALRAVDPAPESARRRERSGTVILEDPQAGPAARHAAAWRALLDHRGVMFAAATLLALPLLLLTFVEVSVEAPPGSEADQIPASLPQSALEGEPAERAAGPQSSSVPALAEVSSSSESKESATPAPRLAMLDVSYRNWLQDGVMEIAVDGKTIWSRRVGSDGVRERTLGSNVRARISVPNGRHRVEVQIDGSEGKVHASRRIWGEFEAGKTRNLKVFLLPPHTLKLSWN